MKGMRMFGDASVTTGPDKAAGGSAVHGRADDELAWCH